MRTLRHRLAGAAVAAVFAAGGAQAQSLLFWSTQANPVAEAQAMRDQVLAVVAHDLRNPLAVINFAATGHQPPAGEADRRNPKWTQAILRSTGRMNRLITDLLDITRIEAGKLSIERAPLSPAELLAECIEAERSLAAGASVALHLHLADELPEVLADHDRLLQVLENLIGNAIKFTPAGGQITMATPFFVCIQIFSKSSRSHWQRYPRPLFTSAESVTTTRPSSVMPFSATI